MKLQLKIDTHDDFCLLFKVKRKFDLAGDILKFFISLRKFEYARFE